MDVHIHGIDPQLWKLVLNVYTLLQGTTDVPLTALQIKENDRVYELDSKAMSILDCGYNRTEYNRISLCTTSTEIWTRLEVTHKGTDEVKQTRITTLNRVYENFKMIPGEDIDSFFTRFADNVNLLMSLGRSFTQEELVTNALWSLKGTDWKNKRNAIEEGKDIKTMTFNGLMGNLKTFEVQTRIEDEQDNPQKAIVEANIPEKKAIKEEKNLALKSSKFRKEVRCSIDSDELSDEEISLMTQEF